MNEVSFRRRPQRKSDRFHDPRPLVSVEHAADVETEDDARYEGLLHHEIERRRSPEYQKDAAHDFVPVLEASQELLNAEGWDFEDVRAIVALDTGARLIGMALHEAVQHTQQKAGRREHADIAFIAPVRSVFGRHHDPEVLQKQQEQELYNQLERALAMRRKGPILIIDDTLHSGESLATAIERIVAVTGSDEALYAIVLGESKSRRQGDISKEAELPIPVVVFAGEEMPLSRWWTRDEGSEFGMPEFHVPGVLKSLNGSITSDTSMQYMSEGAQRAYAQFIETEREAMRNIGRYALQEFIALDR